MSRRLDDEQLARRVSWLDRYRRPISATVGLAAMVAVVVKLYEGSITPAWSRFHIGMLGLVAGFLAWIVLEVWFAYLTALWETELSRRSRGAELPRAVVRPKRKSGADKAPAA